MSQENVELVRGVYAAFGRRDVEDVARCVSPDFVAEQSPELPWGGSYRGLDGLQKFLAALTSHVHSNLAAERFLDAGENVVLIGRTQGTTVADGRPFDVPVAHVWKIRDGKLVEFRPYIDNPTMLSAIRSAAPPSDDGRGSAGE